MSLILVLNAGSSSVKFALIEIAPSGTEAHIARGAVDGIGQKPRWSVKLGDGTPNRSDDLTRSTTTTHQDAVALILRWIEDHYGLAALKGAGHRVVHGGADFAVPVLLDVANIAALKTLIPLAPLHQPHNLAAIESLRVLAPDLPQIACFDTAFHATVPDVERHFALPRAITAMGVRRYGFHGLSYHFIAEELARTAPNLAKSRVVVAHLGNGASLCAMRGGKSVATTMGFSAVDGLMMGTRTGSIDPAVIFYLVRNNGMSAAEIETMFYNQSGLLGVSGLSSDMRILREAIPTYPQAREAVAMFTYRIIREIGAMIAVLGGIDGLVFTAGIGEHDAQLRSDVVNGLSFAGFSLDQTANAGHLSKISSKDGPTALVIPTNEELMIARETVALLNA